MNMLVRGVPDRYKPRIEKLAHKKNLSINQMMVQFVIRGLAEEEREKTVEQRRSEAIQRLKEIREELYRRHGLFPDSVQLIREDRDRR